MHLTSTTPGDETTPECRPALRRVTDRAALPGIIAFVAALAAIEGRLILLAHRNLTELLRIGTVYGHRRHVPGRV